MKKWVSKASHLKGDVAITMWWGLATFDLLNFKKIHLNLVMSSHERMEWNGIKRKGKSCED